jgi:hypothetical protein
MSTLNYDEEYGQCPRCTRVFVVSVFGTDFCNYDRTLLKGIGQQYPTTPVKVGP